MPYANVIHKWQMGKLHSSGPGGPIVKDKSQALAIMESEKKKAAAGDKEYMGDLRKLLGRPQGRK